MKTVVTLGNCQGQHLAYLLGRCLPADEFEVVGFSNNARTGDLKKTDDIVATVQRSDVFIYQPLNEKHGPLCTSLLVSQLKPGASTAALPYFYNDGAYSLCHAPQAQSGKPYGAIFGEQIIVELLKAGLSQAEILGRYREGLIDFRLPQRFADSLAQMKSREESCDVKLTGYIGQAMRQEKLFLTHNHPTNSVFFEVMRQLAPLTGLPIAAPAVGDESLSELARTNCPVSPHDVATMGYTFQPDPDWFARGSSLIVKIVAEWRSKRAAPAGPARQKPAPAGDAG